MIAKATFSETAYWKSDNFYSDDSCESDCSKNFIIYKAQAIENLNSINMPMYAFLTIVTLSSLLDFICWKWRRVSVALFYLECLSIFVETILLGHLAALFTTVITFRFCAAVIFFSTEAFSSIITATMCTVLTLTST